MKKIVRSILLVSSVLALSACNKNSDQCPENAKSSDLCIIFTNDVHCVYDEAIGYAGLSSYKKEMQNNFNNVLLVDSGDHVQGSFIGSATKGMSSLEIMNAIGYDYAILGNHEFDYGLENLKTFIDAFNGKYICSNVKYTGSKANPFENTIKYDIKDYGDYKVGLIGVSTPYSIAQSSPLNFKEDNEFVVDFYDTEQVYADYVQGVVDEIKSKGATYVVALTHLGDEYNPEDEIYKYSVSYFAEHTKGIDVILDAHSHKEVPCEVRKNKDNKHVYVSQTGTGLNAIGQLVINKNGIQSVNILKGYFAKDEAITNKIDEIATKYEEELQKVVGHTDYPLTITDSDGIRMVRTRETNIGNFVADAYRFSTGADIAICNGGGVRASIAAGDITFSDVTLVNPFGNLLCVKKVTGQNLLDMFEYYVSMVQAEYKNGNDPLGENGSFQQISGLKIEIDTSIPTSIVTEGAEDSLVSVGSTRRITKMEVLQSSGNYELVDPTKEYTIASNDYIMKNGGCGMKEILKDKEMVLEDICSDYQSLIDYCEYLNGDFSKYQTVEGRITVK